MKLPTRRQADVLRAMAEYHSQHGFMPTIREIADLVGLSAWKGVFDHLVLCQAKGLVLRGAHAQARGWSITDLGYWAIGLPAPRVIDPKPSAQPASGTVDVGTRCRGLVVEGEDSRECGVQLFGGVMLCQAHRRAAA